jgi:hypothetical protein
MPDFERTDRYQRDPIAGSRRLVEEDLDNELLQAGETLTVHTKEKKIEIGVRRVPESSSVQRDPRNSKRS